MKKMEETNKAKAGNIVRIFFGDKQQEYVDIDRDDANIFICPNGHHYVEEIFKIFPDYHNPLRDSQKLSPERAKQLIRKYRIFDEGNLKSKRNSFKLDDYALNISLSTLDYIDTHSDFPVVLWPEIGMHIAEQQLLIEKIADKKIRKFLFITHSPFIVADYSDLIKSSEFLKKGRKQ